MQSLANMNDFHIELQYSSENNKDLSNQRTDKIQLDLIEDLRHQCKLISCIENYTGWSNSNIRSSTSTS